MSAPLAGELTFASAETALAQGRDALGAGTGPAEFDLSGVTRTDSAGLALLLELTRLGRARRRDVRFVRAPAQLKRLAEFFGVAGLLALA